MPHLACCSFNDTYIYYENDLDSEKRTLKLSLQNAFELKMLNPIEYQPAAQSMVAKISVCNSSNIPPFIISSLPLYNFILCNENPRFSAF